MKQRSFLPQDLVIDSWAKLSVYFDDLLNRELDSLNALKAWMKDSSELEAVLEEDMAWRYIKMTIDTTNEEYKNAYSFFVSEIQPHLSALGNKLNVKLNDCSFTKDLSGRDYEIYLRGISKSLEIFREENIPLQTELQQLAQQYGEMSASMSVEWEGKNITMQKAASYLNNTDRDIRKQAFEKMYTVRFEQREKLHDLFNQLIEKRHQVAENAGFENFRDYKFESMGRFDYTPQDCFNFHEAIAKNISPILEKQQAERKNKLGYAQYRPWDTEVDVSGKPALQPFTNGEDLIEKSKKVFWKIDTDFGKTLVRLEELNQLDLESKKGKAPGGYNYPLYETGVPFIFMNAVGTQNDMITMMHEGGHAVHSILSHSLELTGFKSLPSEVAELASMSTELISMDFWDEFYDNKEDLNRAKKDQLERALSVLPWVAMIDKFQHWIYENPTHTAEERENRWVEIMSEIGGGSTDWSGYEKYRAMMWQKQLHLYEVPFYYIEYGMAQLGAIAVWRNYRNNPSKAIEQFKNALSLGYTKSLPELYAAAGIQFDFSADYVKELADFIEAEMVKLG